MLLHKLKLTALALLFLAVVATGAGFLARPRAMGGRAHGEPGRDDGSRLARRGHRDAATVRPRAG